MRKLKIVTSSIILATIPSLLVYPQDNLGQADFHVQTVHSRKLKKNFRKKERYHLISYDEILNHPNRKMVQYTHKMHGPVIEIEAPELGGVRFNGDGTKMMGFLEPRRFLDKP